MRGGVVYLRLRVENREKTEKQKDQENIRFE